MQKDFQIMEVHIVLRLEASGYAHRALSLIYPVRQGLVMKKSANSLMVIALMRASMFLLALTFVKKYKISTWGQVIAMGGKNC